MSSSSQKSVSAFQASSSRLFLLVILISSFLVLLMGSFVLYRSHVATCELIEAKFNSVSSNIARELVLGEQKLASNIFNNAIRGLEKVVSVSSLELIISKNFQKPSMSCNASILTSEVNIPLIFSGEIAGIIAGSLSVYSSFSVLIFFLLYLLSYFMLYKIVRKSFSEHFLLQILRPIESLNHEVELSGLTFPDELQPVAEKLKNFRDAVILSEKAKSDLERAQHLQELTSQVAHDIRSPLAVLKSFGDESGIAQMRDQRLSLCITRIEEIANNLLLHNKHHANPQNSTPVLVYSLVNEVLADKKYEFSKLPNLNIESLFDNQCLNLFIDVDRSMIKSIISNLINNSVEACDGNVFISLKLTVENRGGLVKIHIEDNGPGVDEKIVRSLFQKGFTTKPCGNGIGLYSAKKYLLEVGGDIKISSSSPLGTTFTLTIPTSKVSNLVPASLVLRNKIAILDDDLSFHELWGQRLSAFQLNLTHYYSTKDIIEMKGIIDDDTLLLCDFDLSDPVSNGVDIIEKLKCVQNSILVSARQDRDFFELVRSKNISYLPKELVSKVPIVSPSQFTDVLLIDDDKLIRYDWQIFCESRGIEIQTFCSIKEFCNRCIKSSRQTLVFIDSNLGDGSMGEIDGVEIWNKGFENIFISTGYEKADIIKPFWVKDIVDKSPNSILAALSSV